LAGIGAFGGLFDADELQGMRSPVLVASTDGVGTKVKLAASLGRYRGIGMDIVNHCINDILVQGAHPLFFLDYFATSSLQPEVVAEIVGGIAEACRQAGCVLIGGETAEMPGVYLAGEFDLAGTIVGCLEREQMLPRKDIRPGDRLVGLSSNGPHTNGYSLLRKIFESADLNCILPELGCSLADALLVPHRSFLGLLLPLIQADPSIIKGLAHITGGGFIENIPRMLPEGMGACIHKGSWPVLPLFQLAQARGQVSDAEIYRVFNMGIGMVAVVSPQDVTAFQSAIPEQTWLIGEVVEDPRHKVAML
jgi:phosphoribosylaminoimidazole synthetase